MQGSPPMHDSRAGEPQSIARAAADTEREIGVTATATPRTESRGAAAGTTAIIVKAMDITGHRPQARETIGAVIPTVTAIGTRRAPVTPETRRVASARWRFCRSGAPKDALADNGRRMPRARHGRAGAAINATASATSALLCASGRT